MKKTLLVALLALIPLALSAQGAPSALVTLDEALEAAARELGARFAAKTEIAVMGIDAPAGPLSDYITGELNARLLKSNKFTVLERSESAMEAMNDADAVDFGHALGAKVVLVGTFNRYETFSQLRLRAVDVLRSQLLAIYTSRIRNDDPALADFQ
jgi:TolB-like protein